MLPIFGGPEIVGAVVATMVAVKPDAKFVPVTTSTCGKPTRMDEGATFVTAGTVVVGPVGIDAVVVASVPQAAAQTTANSTAWGRTLTVASPQKTSRLFAAFA